MLVPPVTFGMGKFHPASLHMGDGDGPVSSAMGPCQGGGTWTQVSPGAHPAGAVHPLALHMPLGHITDGPGAHIPVPLHEAAGVKTPFAQVGGTPPCVPGG